MEYVLMDNKAKEDDSDNERTLSTESLLSFIFAFIVVELYFASPIYFIFKYNRRYIEQKHIPFLQMFLNLLNCSTYVIISLLGTGDFQNLMTNSIGVVICLLVIIKLWTSLSKKEHGSYLFNFFFIFNIIFQIYYFVFKYQPSASQYITIVINIFMYLSLHIGTYYAFKENKPDRIPILSAVLGLLSSIGWTFYAAFLNGFDKITLFSNSLSFIVLISVIICYIYLVKCRAPLKSNAIEGNEKDINKNKNLDGEKGKNMENKMEDVEDNVKQDS